MSWFEALILGLVQGLTEFLPVSSSGHLELGKVLLGVELREDITFSIVVHGATVLSIIVVFFRDLKKLITDSISLKWNDSTSYLAKIVVSMIPVGIVGFLFKDQIESLFTGNILFVGIMLLITASFLIISHFVRSGNRPINFSDSLVIGIAQAVAVLPGISRSGATITAALFLGNKKDDAARFSFLMVLLPIIAANFLDLLSKESGGELAGNTQTLPLAVGFIAAFVSGLFACTWMISLVKKGKLLWFGIYCVIIGSIAIIAGL